MSESDASEELPEDAALSESDASEGLAENADAEEGATERGPGCDDTKYCDVTIDQPTTTGSEHDRAATEEHLTVTISASNRRELPVISSTTKSAKPSESDPPPAEESDLLVEDVKPEPSQFNDLSPSETLNWIKENLINPDDYPKYLPVIPKDDIEFVRKGRDYVLLGSGSYADVYLCRMVKTGKLAALKLIENGSVTMDKLIQETSILFMFNTARCTPSLYGLVAMENSNTYIALGILSEFIGDETTHRGCNLVRLVTDERNSRIDKGEEIISNIEWMRICLRIARCLKCVHQKKVVMNDLKADNILLRRKCSTWVPVIIDFGLSDFGECPALVNVYPSDADKFLQKHGHVAPEYVYEKKTTMKSDLYSLGFLYECVGKDLDLEMSDVVKACSAYDPDERVGIDEVIAMLKVKLDEMLLV